MKSSLGSRFVRRLSNLVTIGLPLSRCGVTLRLLMSLVKTRQTVVISHWITVIVLLRSRFTTTIRLNTYLLPLSLVSRLRLCQRIMFLTIKESRLSILEVNVSLECMARLILTLVKA